MAIQIKTDKKIFPSLTTTIADRNGIRIEWTTYGQQFLAAIAEQSPIFSFLSAVSGDKKRRMGETYDFRSQ